MITRKPLRPRSQPVGREQLDHLARLAHGAHERHHDLDVGQPHVVAHALERPAFQLEAVAEAGVDEARGAAEAQHRILLVRLVALAAEQGGVFVGLEVGQAHDHRLGGERRAQRGDAFGQLLHVEVFGSG